MESYQRSGVWCRQQVKQPRQATYLRHSKHSLGVSEVRSYVSFIYLFIYIQYNLEFLCYWMLFWQNTARAGSLGHFKLMSKYTSLLLEQHIFLCIFRQPNISAACSILTLHRVLQPIPINRISRVESDLLLVVAPIVIKVPISQREIHIAFCILHCFISAKTMTSSQCCAWLG